jgi:hypothetical protein
MSIPMAALMSQSRRSLSQQELHFLLCRAFDRIRPAECKSCQVPKPMWRPSGEPEMPNWVIPLHDACRFNCASFMRWLWRQYGGRYDLEQPL